MRLYHHRALVVGAIFIFLASCNAPQITQGLINVRISADGRTADLQLTSGSTVQDALVTAQVELGSLDRTDPPVYTLLTDGSEVKVVRVTEEFTIEQVVLPFDKQVVRNESLPEGETRLVQPGVTGIQEVTFRRVFEDEIEISVNPVKTVVLQEPVSEIVMIGSQASFAPIPIPGKLVFISSGNAWLMEGDTGNRRPVVVTGDLDGQVFKLSPDGSWLLFTRRSEQEGSINNLWAAKIDDDSGLMIDLEVENIIHFADWVPTSVLRVAYSTVEPRDTAPGWQANNDLIMISFSTNGWISRQTEVLEPNSGGIYGWWGTSFTWAPDGLRLGYARPDGIGIIDLREEDGILDTPVMRITPLQTQSDWAWVPGLAWAPAGDVLYTVDHGDSGVGTSPESSPLFNMDAVPLEGGSPITIVPQTGMFAYPVPSPLKILPSGEQAFELAFLQAIFPNQSDSSRYRLVVMDRDGSNRHILFPKEGVPGLDPQQVLWSPEPMGESQNHWIAIIYLNNLWLVDPSSEEALQLTGDGLVDRLDWR
jgi:hypothetical protein